MHLGVATCASSTCHGRVVPAEDSPVALNEYFIWSKYDHHSNATKLLGEKWSQRIAANMGIGDPREAEECLVCHSDFVPPEQRGEQFLLSDGIGCEACHGGAEHWIASHYGPDASHQANLDAGLDPTEDPQFLAQLCQSCHLGSGERFVTHEMMAAGHPRLRFELDTWMVNMPPHHIVDADYRERKGATSPIDRWAAGILAQSAQYLELLESHIGSDALIPDPALFDCHSCHRPMDTGIRRTGAEKRLLPAGTVRPDDHALRMATIIVTLRDKSLAERIRNANHAMHAAAATTTGAFLDSIQRVSRLITGAQALFDDRLLSAAERKALRLALLKAAADGEFRDYADAEQLFLALQALSAQTEAADNQPYDRLYQLLDNERDYAPARVAAEARRLLAQSRGG